jgi:hypothetical protein
MRVTVADLEVEAATNMPSLTPAQVEADQIGNLATIARSEDRQRSSTIMV